MGRLFAALVVITCAGYLLQVEDSALKTSGMASPADYFVFVTSLGVSMPTVKITRISTEPERLAMLQQA